MIVTIDGPAGAGKSSVARGLAQRLGFRFLDTGAMYRAVAWAVLQAALDPQDDAALGKLVQSLQLQLRDGVVLLDGEDVSDAIRSPQVTAAVRHVADSLPVRQHLSQLQRQLASQADTVTEGRDQGTVVFPQAECKIFLTASPQQRARRRQLEMQDRGETISLAEVLTQQNQRDAHDARRRVGALRKAADAVEVCTDDLSVERVLDRLEQLVRQRQAGPSSDP